MNLNTVTSRALVARINRRLAHDHERLCKWPVSRNNHHQYGNYYIVDRHNNISAYGIKDLAALAKEVGVMHERETLLDN